MCGIAGIVGNKSPEHYAEDIGKMVRSQTHRGPEAQASICGSAGGFGYTLGHCRLKIIDLSDDANQPFFSNDKRYVIVFNGEIYNYVELRSDLQKEGATFRTSGDTEVLLTALIHWGSQACKRLNGMWAFFFLDTKTGMAIVSRDRFGIKPFYYCIDNGELYFGSEIKSILLGMGKRFSLNLKSVYAYVHQNILSFSNDTFFAGISEFPAAHVMHASLESICSAKATPQRYWSFSEASQGLINIEEVIGQARELFADSVKLRLRSDVPVGVLLSGGLDSSSAAAFACGADSGTDVRLFSAVDRNGKSDEHEFIDIVAKHLGRPTEKVFLDFAPDRAFELVEEACWYNDEPINSFSTVAHFLLMRRAREHGVTVLLSGQGADELLCGYKKYALFDIQAKLRRGNLAGAAGMALSLMRQGTILNQFTFREAKRYMPSLFRTGEIDVGGERLRNFHERINMGLSGGDLRIRQKLDVENLSVPELVHYEDRMSMASAREIRLPFLDYRVADFFLNLPIHYKLRDGWTKWVMRKAVEGHLPAAITWRKDKQGFIVPQLDWFTNELRPQTKALIRTPWLSESAGLTDKKKFAKRYEAYLNQRSSGGRYGTKDIFNPVVLELWMRKFEPYLSLS